MARTSILAKRPSGGFALAHKDMIKFPLLLPFLAIAPVFAAPLEVAQLRTDHQVNPGGVSATPSLSWNLIAKEGERGKRQSAYHILAASSADKLAQDQGDLWDSKMKKDSRFHLIKWKGSELKEGAKVHWKVKVTDEQQEAGSWSKAATFTVGGKKSLSPASRTSTFESNSADLNRVYKTHINALGSRLGKFTNGNLNALGLGATLQLATREYLYHFDAAAALSHWLDLTHGLQNEAMLFPSAPADATPGMANSDASILVPHGLWWMTGDAGLIASQWKKMDNYMVARERADQSFRGRIWGNAAADQSTQGAKTPREFLDLAYLGLTTRVMKDLAIPGQEPLTAIRYKDFTARLQKSFARQYLTEKNELTLESQTAHLLALRSNLVPADKRDLILKNVIASLKADGLQAGPLGTQALFPVLNFTGEIDLAIDLLTQKDSAFLKKSMMGTGATEWLMGTLAGLDSAASGFQQIRIRPQIPSNGKVTKVKATHRAAVGLIEVSWTKSDDSLALDCTIPPGTLAIIDLPIDEGQTITESSKTLKDALGTQRVDKNTGAGTAQILAQSGKYQFLIK